MIKFITDWILKAFSGFVPKKGRCRMGTAQIEGKSRSFPADFFHNLRIFLFISSPAYRLPPTAYYSFPLAPIPNATALIAIPTCLIAIASALIASLFALSCSIIAPGF